MPDFEFEFNQNDKDLIVSQQDAVFGESNSDYIRLTIYPSEAIDNIVTLQDNSQAIFYSSLSPTPFNINVSPFGVGLDELKIKTIGGSFADINDFKIYKTDSNEIYIKPNEIFNKFELPEGNYKIQIDFLNQVTPIKIEDLPFPEYLQEFDIEQSGNSQNIIDVQDAVAWTNVNRLDIADYIVGNVLNGGVVIPTAMSKVQYLETLSFPQYFEEFDINADGDITSIDVTDWVAAGRIDISEHLESIIENGTVDEIPKASDTDEELASPPEEYFPDLEILESYSDEEIEIRPIENFYATEDLSAAGEHYQFIIKQISTSRKEIRLKLINTKIFNDSSIISQLTTEFNQGLDKYQFKHVLNTGTGDHIPIMNYQFDKITDGRDNQSIILKLYEPLPTSVGNLSMVTIEKEVLTTQVQNIFYFSDVPDVFFGDGLQPDAQERWINSDSDIPTFQSLDELAISASIGDIEVDSLVSASDYGYPNLNTDFNEYTNHTFFGSAKKKLENFKAKVETIQSYYSEISSSLNVSSSIQGDSTFIIKKRDDLFQKINEEFKNFTPYERFLYFDGQSDSSASAPSLKNYADTLPVTLHGSPGSSIEGIELNQHNGFNVVYKHSSEKLSGNHNKYIDLFTDKYKVENKPFFNYSGSIYLSFLMQGDSGSSLTWENRNKALNPPLPLDTLYQNNIQNPVITGSSYQRYVFQASQSYFIPNTRDTGSVHDMADLDITDFNANSTKITILSGSDKTGSYQIKDSTNQYPTTVVSHSGVPFSGSIMPAGELFRIFNVNNLSSSLLGYYDYVDADIVTDGNNFEILDKSGNNNTLEFGGSGTSAFTSASIVTGVQGGDAFAFKTTGSLEGESGSMFLSTQNSTAPIESAPISMSAVAGDAVTGFTMATYYKSTSTKANATILAMDIKSGSTDVDGWHVNRLADTIGAEVTREGVNILDNDTSADGLKTGTLTPRDGNFHHIALTYDNLTGTGSVYFDGVLQKQGNSRGFITGSNQIYRMVVGSGPGSAHGYDDDTFDETRFYTRALTPSEINQLYLHPDGKTETKITDVKVTLKDPTDVLPFDNLFHTSSTEWTNWYNNALTTAETFDTDNIHSFENNLPLYIQESSKYKDMKDFLNLQGEQYDLIRNHVDSLGTLHKRGYKKTNSPPNNTLPMLLNNMGYQAINPFSGSLTDSLGGYLSGVTSIDDIKNATWRKTLNNLIYIYKSKGTKNSVRGLLNIYGYPPDILKFEEFGSTPQADDAIVFSDEVPDINPPSNNFDLNLNTQTGSFGFTNQTKKLYRYIFNGKSNRILNLDWWMDDANINTFEFVYKHVQTTNTQTIVKSSGSGAQSLWDLRLIPSSDGASSSFEFRLNNSQRGGTAIASRGFSMSLAYNEMTDGQLWNVMIQRMTGSADGPGTIEYRLHSALQQESAIETYSFVSMSISGGLTGDSTIEGKGFFANQNWQSSGSRNHSASANLFIGETFSGSLAEIKGWSTALSVSKFRQRTLNKLSTTGNSISSHCKELIYHFKLNENYNSSSVSSSTQNLSIIDASPNLIYSDYSFTASGQLFVTSSIYGFDFINVTSLTLQDNFSQNSDNNIFINPNQTIVGNLNPNQPAINSLQSSVGIKEQIKTSPKLELYRSPQTFINNFILDKVSGFNLEKLYGNPKEYYSQSYDEFNTFRKEFFDCYKFSTNTNTFIRAQESMFNNSIAEGIKTMVPARSTFSDENSNFGVEIKPTLLEKQKYQNEKQSVEANPNTAIGSHSISVKLSDSLFGKELLTIYDSVKEGEVLKPVSISGSLEDEIMITCSISLGNTYQASTGYIHPPFLQPGGYSGSIEIPNQISGGLSYLPVVTGSVGADNMKSGSINYASDANESYISVHKNWGTGADDVYFINYFNTGSDSEYNTYHIDTRFVFHTIGDNEYYSASFDKIEGSSGSGAGGPSTLSSPGSSNFTNASRFYNRKIISNDFHSDIKYESYITGSPGEQVGRMIGKTRYFTTSSDGNIILPTNHVTKFSQPFKDQMINGAQNINPGQLNVQHEDYSTSSFYRVDVTGGENQIVIQSGAPDLDEDNRIMYDD